MIKKITSFIFIFPPLLAMFAGAFFFAQADYTGQDVIPNVYCEYNEAIKASGYKENKIRYPTDDLAILAMTGESSSSDSDLERQLETEINDMLIGIDLSELENYLNQLEANQRELFNNQSFGAMVRRILNGDNIVDYDSFASYIISLILGQITVYIPLVISIVAIALTMSILSSIKGKFASKSVENVAHFASLSIVIILVTTNVIILMGRTMRIINGLQTQMNIVFPILLTLMTTVGATNSAAVYQPSVLILSNWIINLITIAVLPTFIFSFVFAAVGSLSKEHPLGKLSDFFASVCKWILGIVFFLFLAFLSVQGITAGIYDGVSIRTARFAISRYVPIIGGYLSEGFNLMLAGGVLIKNAVGLAAVILLIVSILPALINIIIFSLSLKLTAALCEPLGDNRIPKYLNSVSKHVTILAAILLGVAFLYFIFLMLIIFTGNMIL